jgi:hypothetical protein
MGEKTPVERPHTYATNGDLVRRLRKQRGFPSQEKAATEWEIGVRTLRDIETGIGASVATLVELAKRLKLASWHDLLSDEGRERLGLGAASTTVSGDGPSSDDSVFEVPYRENPCFTGRDGEIEQLHARLARGEVTQAVTGLGGIGKTQIAVHYAHRYRREYGYVFWIPADTAGQLDDAFLTSRAFSNCGMRGRNPRRCGGPSRHG